MHATVDFTYHRLGQEWDVTAKFKRAHDTPSFDGPYDDEWELDEIEAVCEDGDQFGEMNHVFIRKFASTDMISIAEDVENEARAKIE